MISKCIVAIVFFCWTGSLQAQKSYGDLYVASVVKVIDGDTFKVHINGVHPLIGEAVLVRIAGIDTPELKSHDPEVKDMAFRAKDFAAAILLGEHTIVLKDVRRDKYFRILADVYVDGANLAQELLESGLARPYDGGTKQSWE